MGAEVSKEVKDLAELAHTIRRSYERDAQWVTYHAETLAELAGAEKGDAALIAQAAMERKAFALWSDGYYEKAIARIERVLADFEALDSQTRG